MNAEDQRFDFARQLARFGDDFWHVSRFARLFADQVPLRMKALRVGLAGRDAAAVGDAAHAVTDLLHALDAAEMAGVADDLARSARDGDFTQARLMLIALERRVDELLATVKRWPPLAA